jgi:ABC-type sugar transport system substrate-binding protein
LADARKVGGGAQAEDQRIIMKRVALLLDDAQNLYQQLLVREARTASAKHSVQLLEPESAGGSSWTQVETINLHLRSQSRPDALLVVLAGSQSMKGVCERVVKAGVPVVLLNRIPDWLAEVQSRVPDVLLAGVAPDQVGIGRIQAEQAFRLVPAGTFVVLVTGTALSAAAVERTRGFLESVKGRFTVHELDGGWSAQGADKALAAWFRVGANRDRVPQIVVCQNDAMAVGVRTALLRQAAASGVRDLARVPLVGCDGLAEEGRASVTRGELAATVVLPPTTPTALQVLSRYWESGVRAGVVRLEATSFPLLETLRTA